MCIYIHTHGKSTCGKMNFKKISLHNTQHAQLKCCLPTSFSRDGSPPPSSRLLQEDRAEGDEVSMLVSGPGPGEKLIPRRAPDPSLAGRLRGLGPGCSWQRSPGAEVAEPLRPCKPCTAPSKRRAVSQLGFGNVGHPIFYEAPEIWVFICNVPFFNVSNSNLFLKAL